MNSNRSGSHSSLFSPRRLVRCAMVAALYAVLCLMLAPFSYGAVQVRLSEALCVFVVFGPEYAVGVTVGCFLANLLGFGFPDILFGTMATLLAALISYRLRRLRIHNLAIPAALPPVVLNALIVGPEIAWYFSDSPFTPALCAANALSVGLGEAVSCLVLGVLAVRLIEASPALRKAFTGD